MKKIENEIVKPLILHDTETGMDYTLEFSRDTVRWCEARGFKLEDISNYPMTKIYEFFWYAFRMHHKNISLEKTDRIIDEWGGIEGIPDGVLERLGQLYAAPFSTLQDGGEDRPRKVTVEL